MELTDFEYKLPGKEKKFRVKKLKAPFVLLYINDPECDDCSLTTLRLSVSQALWLGSVEKYPKEWVVASMENGDRYFDLMIMPALYLLDKDKKIILRNTSLEEVEKILKENK